MKEIHIARTIINKRREQGITQDDLAGHMGVSKASVSKWETGQSYPDITLLPQLAAFFNISLDELMDYEPQMSKADIRSLYLRLSADFADQPFNDVLGHCRRIAKKYFSCFPLLFQIGALLVNNSMEAGAMEQTMAVIGEAKELFLRVRKESGDAELCRLALNMEAVCALTQGKADEVIALLAETGSKIISSESLLASAYQMLGKSKEAKSVLQVGIYQHMLSLFGALTDYLPLCADAPEQFEETYRRALAVAGAFDLRHLHPAALARFDLLAAQGYTLLGDTRRALEILEEYARLVTGDIYPLQLRGDAYFHLLDAWIDALDLGAALPRDEKTIRQSMVDGIVKNPAFAPLAKEPRFERIVENLKSKLLEGAV